MKRGLIIVFLLIFILEISLAIAQTKTLTGEIISGKATQTVSINVTVIANTSAPSLTINKPKNQTYIRHNNLELDYSASNENSVWYNLDLGANITITGDIKFNTTNGTHTLYLYAKNSYGTTTENVTFFINSTIFNCYYDSFNDDKKGNSTDFNKFSYEELQNLSNVTFENIDYGKIEFIENINLTDDDDPSDYTINLSKHIKISFNKIEVNSTVLLNFNKSSILSLSNLTFANPRILKDGSVCPSNICTKESYSDGVLKFYVTGFSVYSSEETPETETPSGSSGGGGGGGITEIIQRSSNINVDKEQIKVSLKQGETKREIMTIKNAGNEKINITIEDNLKEFTKISEENFSLTSGEIKIITIDFIAPEDTFPNLYIGKLILKSRDIEKEILIAVEVKSKEPLFDVRAIIPKENLRIISGEDLIAEIEIFNLGNIKIVDAEIEYLIKNENNEIIKRINETIAIETQTNFLKTISIPENLKEGKYFLYVKVTYNSKIASSSVLFEIVDSEYPGKDKIYIIFIIFILIILWIFIQYLIKMSHKSNVITKKAGINKLLKR